MTDGPMDRRTDGPTDGRMDRRTDGRTDRRTDGPTEKQSDGYRKGSDQNIAYIIARGEQLPDSLGPTIDRITVPTKNYQFRNRSTHRRRAPFSTLFPASTNLLVGSPGLPPVSVDLLVGSPGLPPASADLLVGSSGLPPASADLLVGSPGLPPASTNLLVDSPGRQPPRTCWWILRVASLRGPAGGFSGSAGKSSSDPVDAAIEQAEGVLEYFNHVVASGDLVGLSLDWVDIFQIVLRDLEQAARTASGQQLTRINQLIQAICDQFWKNGKLTDGLIKSGSSVADAIAQAEGVILYFNFVISSGGDSLTHANWVDIFQTALRDLQTAAGQELARVHELIQEIQSYFWKNGKMSNGVERFVRPRESFEESANALIAETEATIQFLHQLTASGSDHPIPPSTHRFGKRHQSRAQYLQRGLPHSTRPTGKSPSVGHRPAVGPHHHRHPVDP
ncbi:hypothetical protein BV898_17228 [Hypsibius exemplaris]|uniref:Uncharacterized protein n=1 Tax=Hypsibius exemplaris TaxID=2072580 RepID=A0A9X6NHP0_HYPEX|nr:hypothetical protein BV898_17228 [Hypsibius exemplaris]